MVAAIGIDPWFEFAHPYLEKCSEVKEKRKIGVSQNIDIGDTIERGGEADTKKMSGLFSILMLGGGGRLKTLG